MCSPSVLAVESGKIKARPAHAPIKWDAVADLQLCARVFAAKDQIAEETECEINSVSEIKACERIREDYPEWYKTKKGQVLNASTLQKNFRKALGRLTDAKSPERITPYLNPLPFSIFVAPCLATCEEAIMSEQSPTREPKRRFAERWGVSTRTIDRWVQDGLLEEPEVINGRAYFRTDARPRGSRATEAAA